MALGLILLALVIVPLSSAAPVAGPATPMAGETIWAYGATANSSVNGTGLHGQFRGTATYGFSTILTQTNTSLTNFSLTENHTVGASVQLTYCRPNCTSPVLTANFSARAWEQWTSVANLTARGAVTLSNGTTVPGLALVSGSTQAAANVTESLSVGVNGTTHLVRELFVSVTASSSVGFAPPLGLMPLNATPGEAWTASAQFTASGSWASSYRLVGPGGPSRASTSGNLTGSGNVTAFGATERTAVDVQGQRGISVEVHLGGPALRHASDDLGLGFDIQDGFALVPRVADIWANTGDWGAWMDLTTRAGASTFDMTDARSGHLGLESAAWSYATSVNQYDTLPNSAPSIVQGAPMSPGEAQASASCLAGGACASVASAPGAVSNDSAGAWIVGPSAVASVALVAALLWLRRK